ncbi:MAG: hypothetical protein HYZ75_07155 [Elusimicrobia bacterium]|nr:hypothetical protein [Elusimicrobiota bacterium]
MLPTRTTRSTKRFDPVKDSIREHAALILTAMAVGLCIVCALVMRPAGPSGARMSVFSQQDDDPSTRPAAVAGAPAPPSGLDFAPRWAGLPLSGEQPPAPAPAEKPAAAPAPEPESGPVENPITYERPIVPGKAAKKAVAVPSNAGDNGGKRVISALPSFGQREDKEREERVDAAVGGPAGEGGADPKRARTMRAIVIAGQDGSLQRFGVEKEMLYRLDKMGVELNQYVQPDGTFKISEQEARQLSERLGGINKGAADVMPGASGFGY